MAESTKLTAWEMHSSVVEEAERDAAIERAAAFAQSVADFECLMEHLNLPMNRAILTTVQKNLRRRRLARLS